MGMRRTCYVVLERQANGPKIHSLHTTMDSVNTLMEFLFPPDKQPEDSLFYWEDGMGHAPDDTRSDFGLERGELNYTQDGSATPFYIQWRILQNMGGKEK